MCNLMSSFGWTWETAEEMDLPRYYEISAYWERHPPTHLLVAAYFGYNGEDNKSKETASDPANSLNDLIQAFGGQMNVKVVKNPAP